MATLIKNKQIVTETWQQLSPAAEVPASGDWVVPLAVWTAQRATLAQRNGRNGVVLDNTDDPRVLVADFDKLSLIEVRFPKFTDGRGYSIARLLRRLGWKGELRAVGDVLRDQLFYMTRCGFDAFALRADQNVEAMISAFSDFSASYQPAIEADGARIGAHPLPAKPAHQSTVNPW